MSEKVFLFRVFEKTSANGNRYFSGRWGGARILLFRDATAESDDPVWQVFAQAIEGVEAWPKPEPASGRREARQPKRPALRRAAAMQSPLGRRGNEADGLPFNDSLDDLP